MPDYLPPLLAYGIPLLCAAAAFVYCKRTMDGPSAQITVVDARTMRLAQSRIAEALESGDLTRAYTGLTALIAWLRFEVRTGSRKTRVAYAAELEQAELQKNELAARVGLSGYKP